ncbi:hypothetical protein [Sphingomonas oryzagri]
MQFASGRSPWDFSQRLRLYERVRAKSGWRPDRDIDWDAPLALSPERLELASQLACTGSYTEEIGLLTCGRLLSSLDDLPARYMMGLQIADETKHSEVFTRLAHRMSGAAPPPPPDNVNRICDDLEGIRDPISLFLVHTLLEGFAHDQFKFIAPTFEGDPLGAAYQFVIRDEARHVAMGIDYLRFALHRNVSDEVLETIEWCEANVRAIGFISPVLMDWLAGISGQPSSDIAELFEARHQARLDRIWKRGRYHEEA